MLRRQVDKEFKEFFASKATKVERKTNVSMLRIPINNGEIQGNQVMS